MVVEDRKIKKQIYAPAHEVLGYFPPGWGDVALAEANQVLTNLCWAGKHKPQVSLREDHILIENIDFRSMLELPFRMTTFREFFWVLLRNRATGIGDIKKSWDKIPWDLLFDKSETVGLVVDSKSSRLFHENMLKDCITDRFLSSDYIVKPLEEAKQRVSLTLRRNQLVVGLGLGGQPLYQRGYKTSLCGVATMAEHVAQCLLRSHRLWLGQNIDVSQMNRSTFVPFAGSGTFGFESIILDHQLPLFLWRRRWAFLSWRCVPKASISWLKEQLQKPLATAAGFNQVAMLELEADHVKSIEANICSFSNFPGFNQLYGMQVTQGDFFEWESLSEDGLLQCYMNPPWGLRIKAQGRRNSFYLELAHKLISVAERRKGPTSGFCLMITESDWRDFMGPLKKFKLHTRHFSSGGKDVRVVNYLYTA